MSIDYAYPYPQETLMIWPCLTRTKTPKNTCQATGWIITELHTDAQEFLGYISPVETLWGYA